MDRYTLEQAQKLATKLLSPGFVKVDIGRNNWVFLGNEMLLTIPRHERVKSYAVRVGATNLLRDNGIPVPEILDYSPGNLCEPEYLLVRRIDGDHVNLKSISSLERELVHQSAGEILSRIHKLQATGYGRLNPRMVGENQTWLEFVDYFFAESIKRLRSSTELYKKFGPILEKEYELGKPYLINTEKPSVLHADFHLGNLLFSKNQVCAVLDLDIISSGDKSWDTGHYCRTFNIDRLNGVKHFKRGYGGNTDNSRERFYSLILWTRKIGSQALQRPEALNETIPELEKTLRGEI